jgi:hypothetical protein
MSPSEARSQASRGICSEAVFRRKAKNARYVMHTNTHTHTDTHIYMHLFLVSSLVEQRDTPPSSKLAYKDLRESKVPSPPRLCLLHGLLLSLARSIHTSLAALCMSFAAVQASFGTQPSESVSKECVSHHLRLSHYSYGWECSINHASVGEYGPGRLDSLRALKQ